MLFLKSNVIIKDNFIMWDKIVYSFQTTPRNVSTNPIILKAPLYFYTYAENGKLYVETGRNCSNSSIIESRRQLIENECDKMYELYLRRKRGERVSSEANKITVNQVYWYGIFADFGY